MTTKALSKIIAERFALVDALRLKNVEMLAAMREHDLQPGDHPSSLTIFNDHAAMLPRRTPGRANAAQFDRVLTQLAKGGPLVRKRARALSEGRVGESRMAKSMRVIASKNLEAR